jgi:hypothetical protein
VCDPSQKISRIERDTNVIYTHTRMELCAQYCVREAFYIFFLSLGMLLLCHLFSVFFFPSVDKSSTSLFFHLTELQIHPIRIGYVQSERGEQDFFSLLPADKKKKTQGKKKENRKKRFRMRYRSVLLLPIILERLSWAGYLDSLTLLHHDAISIHLASTR